MHLSAIAPATKTVALGSAAVDVAGISMRKLTQLIVAYPDLIGFVTGGNIDVALLLQQAPEAALAVFSLGLVGRARLSWFRRSAALIQSDSEDDALAAFDNAAAGQQIEILGAIFDLTSKGGDRAVPFLRAIVAPRPAPEPAPPPSETSAESMPASSSD